MKVLVWFICIELYCWHCLAQNCCIGGFLAAEGVLSTPNQTPFWMRSDQFGNVPLPGSSGGILGGIYRNYDSSKKHLVDWGVGFQARLNIGETTTGELIEGYFKIRISIFEFLGGRSNRIMGLVDTTLSSGAFSISGNSLGIPEVQLSIPNYFTFPFLWKVFSIKGSVSHGWIGEAPIQTGNLVTQAKTYFLQQSLYGRLGKANWKFHFSAGFNHQAFWGNEKDIFGNSFQLSPLETYKYVALGETYNGSKIGNHLGSVDVSMEYDFNKIRISLYRQFFYDEGALFHAANLRDGLNGLSVIVKQKTSHLVRFRKFVLEVFYSKDQAGYPWSKRTPSGDENYYNNYEYAQGWSYKGTGLGNPFITPKNSTVVGLPNDPHDYFNNNRVVAVYFGIEGSIKTFYFTTKLSYSWNYGTFGTSPWGHSTGSQFFPPIYGQFGEINQFSGYVELRKDFSHGLILGINAAIDNGGLFYKSAGFILKLSKCF